jgi:ABC-type sugar transport system ATPase subunit
MNFFDVTIKASKQYLTITLEDGSNIKQPLSSLRAIKEEYLDGNEHEAILGVRGEHLVIGSKGISATVQYTENLGNDTIVLANLSTGKGFNISCKNRTIYNQGDSIKVSFNTSDIHLFEKESEHTLYKE